MKDRILRQEVIDEFEFDPSFDWRISASPSKTEL